MLIDLKKASAWASDYLNRNITSYNISYLIQYGRINRYGGGKSPLIKLDELKIYYDSYNKEKELKKKFGDDLNWRLSFTEYKESERTKHVHRLHPYKGKFIPQLVEYFLDSNTDEFKQEKFFNKGDTVLDPFCGSGTTLIQANELGINAIGIDISAFNSMISNAKIKKYNISDIKKSADKITAKLEDFQKTKNNIRFEKNLLAELSEFNRRYFPSPEYKIKVRKGEIEEKKYAKDKEEKFLNVYFDLVKKYNIKIVRNNNSSFLDKWFLLPVRKEINCIFNEFKKIEDNNVKKILTIILSRTLRSCRATPHADLETLKEPVIKTYYCKKHGKICKPLFSLSGWWKRYVKDTIKRIFEFDKIRTNTFQKCLAGDSRTINIKRETKKNSEFGTLIEKNRIDGIFSSPPYVGLINYHEQHAYAYELFGFKRKDSAEIGPLYKRQGIEARKSYIKGISDVLNNCKFFLKKDYNIFLVANDKYGLYPQIVELSGMKIINQYKRPVLNRIEKDRAAYSEIIFHIKEQ
ncbi:MAG: site-specific DNA-methyltransferase [Deltaproteobacteria bacterium]|nr:site-specific DNA-methyltransferase [Deltaproteobacteria bacterium]